MNYVSLKNGWVVAFGRGQMHDPNAICVDQEIDASQIDELYWDGERLQRSEQPSLNHIRGDEAPHWEFSEELAWEQVRLQRERLFAQTAWVRERASDRGEPVPQKWLDYWQTLRDITDQDVHSIEWPVQPEVPQ